MQGKMGFARRKCPSLLGTRPHIELPRSKLTGYQTNRESLTQLSPPFDTTFPSIRALRATQDDRISINRLSRVATWGGRASRDSGQTDFFADSPRPVLSNVEG